MGEVYLADDLKLERQVAIKFLPEHLTKDKDNVERFEREAKAAAALNHPNIVTIYDVIETESQICIVMEYVDGKSLREILNTPLRPPLIGGESDISTIPSSEFRVPNALNIITQIAEGLSEAHKADIVHRDIKPENILIDNEGRVKILDFGLAKLKGVSKLTKESSTLGTVNYMSPEQARGESVDHRSDIWSFGIVLYELFSGRLPFQGDYEQSLVYSILNDEPEPITKFKHEVSSDLEKTVHKALKKDKTARYQSVTELEEDLIKCINGKSQSDNKEIVNNLLKSLKSPRIFISAMVVIIIISLIVLWSIHQSKRITWARNNALPEITKCIEFGDYIAAFNLAEEAEQYIPDDPLLQNQWSKMSQNINIDTEPSHAEVYYTPYMDIEIDWKYLGLTPIDSIRIPDVMFRWKLEKKGYQTVLVAAPASRGEIRMKLYQEGTAPKDMVLVMGGKSELRISGLDHLNPIHLADFYIDKFEVTNKQFKVWVDKGGYKRQEFWKNEFVKGGKILTWQEAMAEFVDATGRTGPATWEVGNYPEGQENYPVSGVSWYEASAYAEFVAKELPTIYHWGYAAGIDASENIIPLSNFGDGGLIPVGKNHGLGYYGTYDMAGNVREWCFNKTSEKHYILGGAWSDPSYTFFHADIRSPFDRSPANGFRCVKYVALDVSIDSTKQAIQSSPIRDYTKEKPVPEEIYNAYVSLYSYEKANLNIKVEFSDSTHKHWTKEKIYFDAPYGNERMFVYLFLPKVSSPPFQTVILFPGTRAILMRSSANGDNLNSFDAVDFVIKSGRAALCPVYKSTYERRDGFDPYDPNTTAISEREHIIMWQKDLARSIDFLESRTDIDIDKLCFVGSSWGSVLGPVFIALDKRFKVCIFRLGGFPTRDVFPGNDPINFAPHVKIPVLMINGKFDYIFPYETSQIPMYQFLGTPEAHKRLVLFDVAHTIPRPRHKMMEEVLNWLDRYLGPVR